MRSTLKHVEVRTLSDGSSSYLFSKRLNPAKGTYAHFSDRFKRKLVANTDAEATIEAHLIAERLDQLQRVCLRDARGLSNTSIELNQAATTWFEVVIEIDLNELRHDKNKTYTKASADAEGYLVHLAGEIVDHWEHREPDHEGNYRMWLSPFGAHLYSMLNDGKPSQKFGESIDIYLKQTNRAHLDRKTRSVARPIRVLSDFTSIIGDMAVDEITRKDVERYINKRLTMNVKTTTVQREIANLRAIWAQVANALEIQTRNPFERQPIHGLGSDTEVRYTFSAVEMRTLLAYVEKLHNERSSSYAPPLLAIATLTGARLSEINHLVSADFDRQRKVLWLRPNERRANLKTANSKRPIPVLPELAIWLERFFRSNDRPSSSNSASANCLKYLNRIDTENKGFTIHGLRHGFKQLLVETDCPGNLIDELMGWSQQSMMKNYGFTTVTQKKIDFMTKAYAKILPSV
ncbi:MAG: hypothetical protein RLZ63_1538 [Pseudomonadota bacterium]|jgi:integrase